MLCSATKHPEMVIKFCFRTLQRTMQCIQTTTQPTHWYSWPPALMVHVTTTRYLIRAAIKTLLLQKFVRHVLQFHVQLSRLIPSCSVSIHTAMQQLVQTIAFYLHYLHFSPLLSKKPLHWEVCVFLAPISISREHKIFHDTASVYVSDSSEISAKNHYQPTTTSPIRSILPLSRHWVPSQQRQASGSNPRPQTYVNNYKFNSRRDEFIPMNLPISALLSGSMDTFWSHYTGKFHEQFT